MIAHMDTVQSFEELGERIRQARLARGLDQGSLAVSSGLERTQITKVESGARGVSALELGRIAGALGLSIIDLVQVPPWSVVEHRRPLEELASGRERAEFDAQTALDRMWSDATQLRECGLLQPVPLPSEELTSTGAGRRLARSLRTMLGYGVSPLPGMADVAARAGLWLHSADLLTDGISMSPEMGFGVAVVSSRLEPGRRRATAAHELGHHVAGDAYASGAPASTPQGERETWIEAFAAELLLPKDVAAAGLVGGSREELIRLSVEYRVSWSLATRVAQDGDVSTLQMGVGSPPTDSELYAAAGRKPAPDLETGTVAGVWVQACVLAEEHAFITHVRALEMARGALRS